jgi:hypothetical protein
VNRQWYAWFGEYIPQVGEDFRYRDGKFAGARMAWNFVVMPFEDMG